MTADAETDPQPVEEAAAAAPAAPTEAPVIEEAEAAPAPAALAPVVAAVEEADAPVSNTSFTAADTALLQPAVVTDAPEVDAPEVEKVSFDSVVLKTLAARAVAAALQAPLAQVEALNTAIEAVSIPDAPVAAATDNEAAAPVEPVAAAVEDTAIPVNVTETATEELTREKTVITIRDTTAAKPTLTAITGEFDRIGENADTANGLVIGRVATDNTGDSTTYALGGADSNLFTLSDDGILRLRAGTALNYEDAASYDITIAAKNEAGAGTEQAFSIAVSDENDLPQITTLTPPGSKQDAAFTYVLQASDEDAGDNLQITAAALPDWLSLGTDNQGNTVLTGTPDNDDVGSATVQLQVSDGTGTQNASFAISVANVNDAPTLSPLSGISLIDTAAGDSFAEVSNEAVGSDIDAGDSLTYAVNGGTATNVSGFTKQVAGTYGTFYLNESTGKYKFVPDDDAVEGLKTDTTESFTVSVRDAAGASAQGAITVNITGENDTPSLGGFSNISFADTDGNDTFLPFTGDATASDADAGETLSYDIVGSEASTLSGYSRKLTGTYGVLHINDETGAYQYVPDDTAIEKLKTDASDSFNVRVSDAVGATADGALTVSVSGSNDTPSLGSFSDISFTDTAARDSFAAITGNSTASDVDGGETLTYAVSGGTSTNRTGYNKLVAGSYGIFYLNETTGAYEYVPDDDAIDALSGTANERFDVSVTDTDGATETGQITVSVNGVNDTPTLAAFHPSA